VTRLRALLGEHPELATERLRNWATTTAGRARLATWRCCATTLHTASGAMYPTPGPWPGHCSTPGALVDGDPADSETPLMTAASYGDPEVARVLIEAGADLDAAASVTAGAVPGGTALRHAAVFGMPDVVEVLMAAGATDLVQAAAAGDITGTLRADTPEPDRVAALRLPPSTGSWT